MRIDPPRVASRPLTTRLLDSAAEAAEWLIDGKLIAFPTETVYGLGVDARNPQAVEQLFVAKGRPADNPLIVHIARLEDWHLAAREMPTLAAKLLEAFAPGPLTVVIPKHPSIDTRVTAGLDTVGVRIPDCLVALELLTLAQIPVAAPSANRSGRPSCTTWNSVFEDLDGRIDGILRGSASNIGIESTVVDCSGERPVVLRPGGVSLRQLQRVVPSAVARADIAGTSATEGAAVLLPSPGMRHPHYRPQAEVWLVDGGDDPRIATAVHTTQSQGAGLAYAGLEAVCEPGVFALYRVYGSVEEFAADFYEFMRECDRGKVARILIQRSPTHGVGGALRERQERSAGER